MILLFYFKSDNFVCYLLYYIYINFIFSPAHIFFISCLFDGSEPAKERQEIKNQRTFIYAMLDTILVKMIKII